MVPPPSGSAAIIQSFFRRAATSFKLFAILVLALMLQIPLWMITGLLRERLERRQQAVAEITNGWGHAQTVTGPILVVPYTTSYSAEKVTLIDGRQIRTTEEKTRLAHAYFLPAQLKVEGDLAPEKRHRGIYEAVVYGGKFTLSGTFETLDPKALGVPMEAMRWDQAWLAFGLSDLRGTREALAVQWDGAALPLEPSTRIQSLNTGLHGFLPKLEPTAAQHTFTLTLTLNGSDSMTFVPVGKQTDVRLRSTWADPSFTGAFLPTEREVGPEGFTATWKISYYGRPFPQQWIERPEENPSLLAQLPASSFGVSLMTPVDSYRLVERATKYGVLFIALLFTAFFLFEVLAALRLHPVHYLLVGAALCLFYLGLLSVSEFASFPLAYGASALAATLLVGGYARNILGHPRRAGMITGALAVIYVFLFFVLQLQDYALIAGTVALFVILAAVMYATRKVDWAAPPAVS